jgi:hypothetical protein
MYARNYRDIRMMFDTSLKKFLNPTVIGRYYLVPFGRKGLNNQICSINSLFTTYRSRIETSKSTDSSSL